MDTSLGVSKVPAKMLRKGLDGRFRGIVCRISWGVGNALFAASDDNGGRPAFCGLLNYREEGVDAMDYPKKVRLENLCSTHCRQW